MNLALSVVLLGVVLVGILVTRWIAGFRSDQALGRRRLTAESEPEPTGTWVYVRLARMWYCARSLKVDPWRCIVFADLQAKQCLAAFGFVAPHRVLQVIARQNLEEFRSKT